MAAGQTANATSERSETTGRAMKRRGILAAAGAVVAGLVAKQASQPVAAATSVTLGNSTVSSSNNETMPTYIKNTVNNFDPQFNSALIGESVNGPGLYGTINYANTPNAAFNAGVYGDNGNANGVGVQGLCAESGGVGVKGSAASGTGVAGTSTSGTGVAGGTGSATPGTAGGYFYTTANNGSGVVGQCFNPGGGAAAFVGAAVAPNYAAYFTGDVVVTGNFVVAKINGVNTGGGKSAAVQHPLTNDTRLVYCVEAPEAWFEDFGEAQVVNGKAEVKVDPNFMALIHTDSYHVFLTEHGGTHHHLSVETKGANGFTVTADAESAALKGKKVADLAGTFSWRVVGKRSDTQLERLAKFTMPTIKTADKPPLEVAPPAPVKKP